MVQESTLQELQVLEHNLQSLLHQKQSFQVELNEITNALSELDSTKDDVFKIISGVMIKSKPEELKSDLKEKQNVLSLRIESIEKQQSLLEKKSKGLRDSLEKEMQKETNSDKQ